MTSRHSKGERGEVEEMFTGFSEGENPLMKEMAAGQSEGEANIVDVAAAELPEASQEETAGPSGGETNLGEEIAAGPSTRNEIGGDEIAAGSSERKIYIIDEDAAASHSSGKFYIVDEDAGSLTGSIKVVDGISVKSSGNKFHLTIPENVEVAVDPNIESAKKIEFNFPLVGNSRSGGVQRNNTCVYFVHDRFRPEDYVPYGFVLRDPVARAAAARAAETVPSGSKEQCEELIKEIGVNRLVLSEHKQSREQMENWLTYLGIISVMATILSISLIFGMMQQSRDMSIMNSQLYKQTTLGAVTSDYFTDNSTLESVVNFDNEILIEKGANLKSRLGRQLTRSQKDISKQKFMSKRDSEIANGRFDFDGAHLSEISIQVLIDYANNLEKSVTEEQNKVERLTENLRSARDELSETKKKLLESSSEQTALRDEIVEVRFRMIDEGLVCDGLLKLLRDRKHKINVEEQYQSSKLSSKLTQVSKSLESCKVEVGKLQKKNPELLSVNAPADMFNESVSRLEIIRDYLNVKEELFSYKGSSDLNLLHYQGCEADLREIQKELKNSHEAAEIAHDVITELETRLRESESLHIALTTAIRYTKIDYLTNKVEEVSSLEAELQEIKRESSSCKRELNSRRSSTMGVELNHEDKTFPANYNLTDYIENLTRELEEGKIRIWDISEELKSTKLNLTEFKKINIRAKENEEAYKQEIYGLKQQLKGNYTNELSNYHESLGNLCEYIEGNVEILRQEKEILKGEIAKLKIGTRPNDEKDSNYTPGDLTIEKLQSEVNHLSNLVSDQQTVIREGNNKYDRFQKYLFLYREEFSALLNENVKLQDEIRLLKMNLKHDINLVNLLGYDKQGERIKTLLDEIFMVTNQLDLTEADGRLLQAQNNRLKFDAEEDQSNIDLLEIKVEKLEEGLNEYKNLYSSCLNSSEHREINFNKIEEKLNEALAEKVILLERVSKLTEKRSQLTEKQNELDLLKQKIDKGQIRDFIEDVPENVLGDYIADEMDNTEEMLKNTEDFTKIKDEMSKLKVENEEKRTQVYFLFNQVNRLKYHIRVLERQIQGIDEMKILVEQQQQLRYSILEEEFKKCKENVTKSTETIMEFKKEEALLKVRVTQVLSLLATWNRTLIDSQKEVIDLGKKINLQKENCYMLNKELTMNKELVDAIPSLKEDLLTEVLNGGSVFASVKRSAANLNMANSINEAALLESEQLVSSIGSKLMSLTITFESLLKANTAEDGTLEWIGHIRRRGDV